MSSSNSSEMSCSSEMSSEETSISISRTEDSSDEDEDLLYFKEPELCRAIEKDVENVRSVYGDAAIVIGDTVCEKVEIHMYLFCSLSKDVCDAWGINLEDPLVVTLKVSAKSYLHAPVQIEITQKDHSLGIQYQMESVAKEYINVWMIPDGYRREESSDWWSDNNEYYPYQNFPKGFLVCLMNYLNARISTLNEYCIICDKTHLSNVKMLTSAVCRRDLCAFAFQNLSLFAGKTFGMITQAEVTDLLFNMTYAAAMSGNRASLIFKPFPTVFDPNNPNNDAPPPLDPNNPNYSLAQRLLGYVKSRGMLYCLNNSDKDEPLAQPLTRWILNSNRFHLAKLERNYHLPSMCTKKQYVLVSAPPAKEARFQELKAEFGSRFAFHGSRTENWYSILRNGLKNASGTKLQLCGAAYGSGIYLSPMASMSMTYSGLHMYGSKTTTTTYTEPLVEKIDTDNWKCIALCEVIDKGNYVKNTSVWVVPEEDHVVTRFFFVYNQDEQRAINLSGLNTKNEQFLTEIRNALQYNA